MELGRIRCVTESAITAAMKSINAANPLFPYRTSALASDADRGVIRCVVRATDTVRGSTETTFSAVEVTSVGQVLSLLCWSIVWASLANKGVNRSLGFRPRRSPSSDRACCWVCEPMPPSGHA